MKTTAREILEAYRYGATQDGDYENRYDIDNALTDLSELVMGEKKERGDKNIDCVYSYNSAITDIAKLFATDKEDR